MNVRPMIVRWALTSQYIIYKCDVVVRNSQAQLSAYRLFVSRENARSQSIVVVAAVWVWVDLLTA